MLNREEKRKLREDFEPEFRALLQKYGLEQLEELILVVKKEDKRPDDFRNKDIIVI